VSHPESILSEFLTKKELAAELRRNPRTLERWAVLGIGPPRTRGGRHVLYRRASVQRWLMAQEQSSAYWRTEHALGGASRRTRKASSQF
jgi:phage terminase Nu1 subunit (DNA packaging protein)